MKSLIYTICSALVILVLAERLYTAHGVINSTQEKLETCQAQSVRLNENANEFRQAIIKAPSATEKMSRIGPLKPELLEKRVNTGFAQLANDIAGETK